MDGSGLEGSGATEEDRGRAAFERFRDEIDASNDRRERLVKVSRDITAYSKKVIFGLHRQTAGTLSRTVKEAEGRLKEIRLLFAQARDELQGSDFHKFLRSIQPGMEEYLEAVSFKHYLEHGSLLSFDEAQAALADEAGTPYIRLTPEIYLLGLADLTGELMRLAIHAVGQGQIATAQSLCTFLRRLRDEYDLGASTLPSIRYGPVSRKMEVMRASVQKCETACYAAHVRGSEYAAMGDPEIWQRLARQINEIPADRPEEVY